MPSGRSKRPEPPSPVFFLDRGLGRYLVADTLQERGFDVLPMADVYRQRDPSFAISSDDPIVIGDSFVLAIGEDYSIIRDHVDTLAATNLRVFSLNNANLTGPQMAERFDLQLNRIVQQATKPGPYLYVVGSKGLERRWPIS